MDLTSKTTERLVIAPDRGKLLMSKELEGLVPGLTDEEPADMVADPLDDVAEIDVSPMVIIERRLVRPGMDPVDAHVIGRLVRLTVGVNELVIGLRLDCSDALAVVADVRRQGTIYAGIQVHHGVSDVVMVPVGARHALVAAVIDEVTTAGTCTLVATLGHV